MSNVCENDVTVIGLALDIIGEVNQSNIEKIISESLPGVIQAFTDDRFKEAVRTALTKQLNKVGENITLSAERLDKVDYEMNPVELGLFWDPVKTGLKETLSKEIENTEEYRAAVRRIEDKLRKLKCTPTGLFYNRYKKKWYFIVAAVLVGGAMAGGVLYYASNNKSFSDFLSKIANGKEFEPELETSIGTINIKTKIVQVDAYEHKYKINFENLALSWQRGKVGESDWRKFTVNTQFSGSYYGKKLVAKVDGVGFIFENRKYRVNVSTARNSAITFNRSAQISMRASNQETLSATYERKKVEAHTRMKAKRGNNLDEFVGLGYGFSFLENKLRLSDLSMNVNTNLNTKDIIYEIGIKFIVKDIKSEYLDSVSVEPSVKHISGPNSESLFGLRFNIGF